MATANMISCVGAAASKPAKGGAGGRDEVYVATTPLRGTKGPGQVFLSTAFSLGVWDLQHFMVIVKPRSSPSLSQAVVFDFQPEDPENLYVALAALSGQPVPGAIMERKISKIPRKRCWLVGSSLVDALEEARRFNRTWETDLRIGLHDCRDYVNGPPLDPSGADGIMSNEVVKIMLIYDKQLKRCL